MLFCYFDKIKTLFCAMAKQEANSFYKKIDEFVPSISLDCVVFGYQNKGLYVLLLKYRNTNSWALPGGFLPKASEMEREVAEILFERTGLRDIFLRQYHTFSSVKRGWLESEKDNQDFNIINSMWPSEQREKLTKWFHQRFISTAFMALVDATKVNPSPDFLSDDCRWTSLGDLPTLALDHREMIDEARKQLRQRINYLPIGKSLLPEKFTMSDLQALYEAVLGEKMDRGNFQRKMMKLGMLNRHEKLMTGASNKAPYLYSLNHEIYDRLIEKGIGFS